MKTKLVLACLIASALAGFMGAATAAAPSVIVGHGADSCAEFSQGRVIAPSVEESYYVWAEGFMSGFNTVLLVQKSNNHNVGAMSEDDQKKALRDYCSVHPSDNFESAVVKMFLAMPEVPPPQ